MITDKMKHHKKKGNCNLQVVQAMVIGAGGVE